MTKNIEPKKNFDRFIKYTERYIMSKKRFYVRVFNNSYEIVDSLTDIRYVFDENHRSVVYELVLLLNQLNRDNTSKNINYTPDPKLRINEWEDL